MRRPAAAAQRTRSTAPVLLSQPSHQALSASRINPRAAAAVWLLHHGASVAAQKEDGWNDTCLHYAAGRGSLETVQALLAWGADPAAENALGEWPCNPVEMGSQSQTGHARALPQRAASPIHAAAGPADTCSCADRLPSMGCKPHTVGVACSCPFVPLAAAPCHPAGATAADVADKAGHRAVACHLRSAAAEQMPAEQPSREALLQRFLGSSGKDVGEAVAHGKEAPTKGSGAAGTALEGPAKSLQLAAAEEGDAAVQVVAVTRGDVSVAAPAEREGSPDGSDSSSSKGASGKSAGSSADPAPAAPASKPAAGRKAVSPAALVAARKLARRGFEGWGTPGAAGGPSGALQSEQLGHV